MPLPTYKKQVQQVATPKQIGSGSNAAAGMIASAQASQSLAQRLSGFSSQLEGMAKGMAKDQASKDAVRDVHTRKQKIADINAKYEGKANSEYRPMTKEEHDERNAEIQKIAEGAEKMFSGVYSKAYNNASTAAYSNQIAVDTAAASDQAMIASEGSSQSYIAQMNAFRKETVKNAPTKETAIIAELSINQYGSKGFKNLKMAEIREDEARRKATGIQTANLQISDVSNSIQEGDWVNASQNLFKLQKTLEDSVKNGWKTADQAALELDTATENGVLKYAKDRFASGELLDGQEFIDKFRNGDIDGEIPSEFFEIDRDKVADRMEYLLDVEQKKYNIKQEADKSNLKEEANIVVGDGIKTYNAFKIPDNANEIEAALPYASLAKQHEYKVMKSAYGMLKPYFTLPLQEQQAVIDSKMANKEMSRDEVEALGMAKKILAARARKAKDDPMGLSFEEGINNQEFVANPMANLRDQSKAFTNRSKMQTANKLEYGKGATDILTKQEAEAYSQWLNSPDTPISAQLDFFTMLEKTIPEKSNSVYAQLMKKEAPVAAYAGSLLKEGKRSTAEKMLKGRLVMQAVDNPQDVADLKSYALKEMGNATANMGKSEVGGALDTILNSVVALYYGDIQDKGKLDKGVGGSQLKAMIKEATNGTHKRNEQSFFLPVGVTSNLFDEWIDDLQPGDVPAARGWTEEQTIKFIQDNKINSYGPNKYSIYQGKSQLKNKDGSVYILSYPQ